MVHPLSALVRAPLLILGLLGLVAVAAGFGGSSLVKSYAAHRPQPDPGQQCCCQFTVVGTDTTDCDLSDGDCFHTTCTNGACDTPVAPAGCSVSFTPGYQGGSTGCDVGPCEAKPLTWRSPRPAEAPGDAGPPAIASAGGTGELILFLAPATQPPAQPAATADAADLGLSPRVGAELRALFGITLNPQRDFAQALATLIGPAGEGSHMEFEHQHDVRAAELDVFAQAIIGGADPSSFRRRWLEQSNVEAEYDKTLYGPTSKQWRLGGVQLYNMLWGRMLDRAVELDQEGKGRESRDMYRAALLLKVYTSVTQPPYRVGRYDRGGPYHQEFIEGAGITPEQDAKYQSLVAEVATRNDVDLGGANPVLAAINKATTEPTPDNVSAALPPYRSYLEKQGLDVETLYRCLCIGRRLIELAEKAGQQAVADQVREMIRKKVPDDAHPLFVRWRDESVLK